MGGPSDAPLSEEGVRRTYEPSSPAKSKVLGLKAKHTVKLQAKFEINGITEAGERCTTGGEAFFVAIRGVDRIRARITDHEDGSYSVTWTPTTSGVYSIAVSLFGFSLEGSPFSVRVIDMQVGLHEAPTLDHHCCCLAVCLHVALSTQLFEPSSVESRTRPNARYVAMPSTASRRERRPTLRCYSVIALGALLQRWSSTSSLCHVHPPLPPPLPRHYPLARMS